jgi:transcriptional regulator with XRE-family HTH domain
MLWCMGVTSSVTPQSRALADSLRAAREEQGTGLRDLARKLGWDHSRLSRYETGERTPSSEDVARILGALGHKGAKADELIGFARDVAGGDRGQWLGVGMTAQQRQLAVLLGYEEQAGRIIDVSPLLIPGLLQTGDYARGIMRAARVPEEEIATRVATRLGRRDTLTRRRPAHLLALVGEQALLQRIGGPEVMADQLRHLQRAGQAPNVIVRVVPTTSAWHPGLEGPWVIVDPAEGSELDPVVHLEGRRSGLFLHRPADVDAYREGVEMVLSVALPEADSAAVIAREATRWEKELDVEEGESQR